MALVSFLLISVWRVQRLGSAPAIEHGAYEKRIRRRAGAARAVTRVTLNTHDAYLG